MFTLPIAQYPDVTPPTVQVTASYPGANANTVRDTVAAPIEEQVSGVEGMLYMSSICTNNGAYTLTVTFQLGTDSDMAQVLVQNRVALALPVIPALVQNEGVTVKKQSPATLLIVNLIGDGDKNDPVYLSNYIDDLSQGRTGPGRRGRRHQLSRPARLQHAGLARSGPAGGASPQRLRCGHRHRPAERAGGGRASRPAPRAARAAVPAHHQHQGPADRGRRVWRHHRQGRRRRPRNDRRERRQHDRQRPGGPVHRHRPAQGRGDPLPGRPRRSPVRRSESRSDGPEVRQLVHAQRPAIRGALGLSTPRLQCSGRVAERPRDHEGLGQELSRRPALRDRLRHDPLYPASR